MNSIYSIVVFVGLAAIIVPQIADRFGGADSGRTQYVSSQNNEDDGPREAQAYRNSNGYYTFNAMLNGTHEKVLVDTGASSVSINESTAQRIGIELNPGDFRYNATTANGKTKYARATIDEIWIDGIVVRDVEAAVLRDSSLSETLLGMTFLNKLQRFEFEGSTLKLTQ